MKILAFLGCILLSFFAKAQSACEKVKLYDEMVVRKDKPIFPKLKSFDISLIPNSTLQNMKRSIVELSSPEFFDGLKMRSVKLFDSAVARSWSWTQEQIVNLGGDTVYFFYAVLFETKVANKTPFVFRLDILENGSLLDNRQLSFLSQGKLNILGCEEIVALVAADSLQPIREVKDLALVYSSQDQIVLWRVVSKINQDTGVFYVKEVNAVTGEVINRTSAR